MAENNVGRVVRVEGPVIDVRFEGNLPNLNNALIVKNKDTDITVELMAIQRTTSSPSCCAASQTMVRSPSLISIAFRRSGRCPPGNRISRTGPII